jgi:hypothetical protein
MLVQESKQPTPAASIILLVINTTILSFGLTLLIFTSLYQQDLSALQRLPEAIWLFVCGVPTEDPIALPLLQVISAVATVGSIAAFLLPPLLKRFAKKPVSGPQNAASH